LEIQRWRRGDLLIALWPWWWRCGDTLIAFWLERSRRLLALEVVARRISERDLNPDIANKGHFASVDLAERDWNWAGVKF
jgi:hypothetical protein